MYVVGVGGQKGRDALYVSDATHNLNEKYFTQEVLLQQSMTRK